MSLGAELRKARQDSGFTQEQLAFAAGLDRAYVSQLENDRKSPTVTVLYLVCDALGIAASTVLTRFERSRTATPKPRQGGATPGE